MRRASKKNKNHATGDIRLNGHQPDDRNEKNVEIMKHN